MDVNKKVVRDVQLITDAHFFLSCRFAAYPHSSQKMI